MIFEPGPFKTNVLIDRIVSEIKNYEFILLENQTADQIIYRAQKSDQQKTYIVPIPLNG